MENEISFSVSLPDSYEKALEKVTAALKNEGFGVLTEIDVKATLKKKIDVDFRRYSILGACNPPLAHKALQSDPLVGLLLPCNVTVEETENGSIVNLVNPKSMLLANPLLAENEVLNEVALDAFARLERVAKDLAGNA
ncbi:MAG TPA: ABC transporter ATP-binding protein [Chloroflexi bacterium]|nr:ABC transporter ATP-binding protein [Chloroflexota bacterium]